MRDNAPIAVTDSSRGDQTRLRLLDAATEIFAMNAYDSVRTRSLANAAGVNQAAIPYYFGGKEGLYLAVAQRIAEELGEQTHQLRRQAQDVIHRQPPASRQEVAQALQQLLQGFARNSLDKPGQSARLAFILREQLHPGKAFDLIYTQAIEPLHRAVGALVARLRGLPEDDRRCVVHTHALIGQVVMFIIARTALLRRLGDTQLQPAITAEIAELTGRLAIAPFDPAAAATLLDH